MDFKLNGLTRNDIGVRIRNFAKWFVLFYIITAIFFGVSIIDINPDANLIFDILFVLLAFASSIILFYLVYILIIGFSFLIENTNK